MSDFPVMTAAQRAELIEFVQGARIFSYIEVLRMKQLRDQIALAALTAKSIAWIETGTDGFERGSRLINYFTSDIQGFDNGTLIYAAPPAPVLNPIVLPCADHETDDGYEFYRKETVIQAIRAAGYEVVI